MRDGNADAAAVGSAVSPLYAELRRLAARHLDREGRAHTLQPTALVNEAYLRLMHGPDVVNDRQHFFALAAQAMRRVLVDYARQRRSQKRGGGAERVTLQLVPGVEAYDVDMLALDEALSTLQADDLRRYIDGRPIGTSGGSSHAFRLWIARNPVPVALGVLLLLSAGAGTWFAVTNRMDWIRLEAKEGEIERLVAMLNQRVDRWRDGDRLAPESERVQDVRTAREVVGSRDMAELSIRSADPPRPKRLFEGLRRFLDRADEMSKDEPSLRKGDRAPSPSGEGRSITSRKSRVARRSQLSARWPICRKSWRRSRRTIAAPCSSASHSAVRSRSALPLPVRVPCALSSS
jgi:DNA-directed RNA polymerase specialized sigma24 family protein